jgi:hypothetical protein
MSGFRGWLLRFLDQERSFFGSEAEVFEREPNPDVRRERPEETRRSLGDHRLTTDSPRWGPPGTSLAKRGYPREGWPHLEVETEPAPSDLIAEEISPPSGAEAILAEEPTEEEQALLQGLAMPPAAHGQEPPRPDTVDSQAAPLASGAEILEHVFLSLPCPHCGEQYEVPLVNIYLSHEASHERCPVSMPGECPEEHWAELLDEKTLQELAATWRKLEAHARADNGELIIRGLPKERR